MKKIVLIVTVLVLCLGFLGTVCYGATYGFDLSKVNLETLMEESPFLSEAYKTAMGIETPPHKAHIMVDIAEFVKERYNNKQAARELIRKGLKIDSDVEIRAAFLLLELGFKYDVILIVSRMEPGPSYGSGRVEILLRLAKETLHEEGYTSIVETDLSKASQATLDELRDVNIFFDWAVKVTRYGEDLAELEYYSGLGYSVNLFNIARFVLDEFGNKEVARELLLGSAKFTEPGVQSFVEESVVPLLIDLGFYDELYEIASNMSGPYKFRVLLMLAEKTIEETDFSTEADLDLEALMEEYLYLSQAHMMAREMSDADALLKVAKLVAKFSGDKKVAREVALEAFGFVDNMYDRYELAKFLSEFGTPEDILAIADTIKTDTDEGRNEKVKFLLDMVPPSRILEEKE